MHPFPDQGPEALKEILARLFTVHGWGRRQGRLHLENAWKNTVGPDRFDRTRVLGLFRGVLEIEVAGSVLLHELAHFQKRDLLAKLRALLPNEKITDLRFKAGAWN